MLVALSGVGVVGGVVGGVFGGCCWWCIWRWRNSSVVGSSQRNNNLLVFVNHNTHSDDHLSYSMLNLCHVSSDEFPSYV